MTASNIWEVVWIYCPRYPAVCGNERVDNMAFRAQITAILRMGRREEETLEMNENLMTDGTVACTSEESSMEGLAVTMDGDGPDV